MDLSKIEPLSFSDHLREVESTAITVTKRRKTDLLRVTTGLLAGGAALGIILPLAFVIGFVFGPGIGTVALSAVIGGFLGSVASTIVLRRYLAPSERRLLAAHLEPDAKRFLESHRDRRESLIKEAKGFDDALEAFKALPAKTGEGEVESGVLENFQERRRLIESKTQAYLAEFEAATEAERARVKRLNDGRVKPERRQLAAFSDKVHRLAELERSLNGLQESADAGLTVDLSPFVAVECFRADLEAEREALVGAGLAPKRLPKQRIIRKLLTSAT